jgi:transcriptional regulator with XRE-family HTH domain
MGEQESIGTNLRRIRRWRGLSLEAAAGLAGYSKAYLSQIENGLRNVDRRSTLHRLADALQVAPSDLTGQPYPSTGPSEAVGHSAASELRAVLRDIEVGEPLTETVPRPLAELRAELTAADQACAASDYGLLGEPVPDLIGELHALAVGGSAEALRLLVDALHIAFYLAKDLGHGDLAWMVAGHLHSTAEALGEPARIALADFVRAHATVGARARESGLAVAERRTAQLQPDAGPGGEVYGMLHLSAALQSAVTGHEQRARDHLAEAGATAGRTGEGSFGGLFFGPTNVGIWELSVALELGEHGRTAELARQVDVTAIPSAGRQATFYGDVGRGLAGVRGQETRAVEALRRAEKLASQRTRTNPYVRETVTALIRRARRDAGSRELRGLAYRMGVVETLIADAPHRRSHAGMVGRTSRPIAMW